MVYLDKRGHGLLKEVLINSEIKNKDLENKFGLNRQQISYSFNKINQWLEEKNLPKIKRTKQGLFIVSPLLFTLLEDESEHLPLHRYVLSEKERAELIGLMLLSRTEELSLTHFTSMLQVSKNTILTDLKCLREMVIAYHLEILYSRQKGYWIEGCEFNKRKLLMDVVGNLLVIYNGSSWLEQVTQISSAEIKNFKKKIERVEQKLKLAFTDEKIESMPYLLVLMLKRASQGKIIDDFHIHYDELFDTREYTAASELIVDLVEVPVEEKLFITLYLLTSNVYSASNLTEEMMCGLMEATSEMLTQFERNACIVLLDKDELLHKILLHLKPAYYRVKFQLTSSNPLQELAIGTFKDLHHILKKSMTPIVEFIGNALPESEMVFLTILIGGWLTRQKDNFQNKVKALIVCPKGVSISKLMESTLREVFPEFVFLDTLSMREFYQFDLRYDVVFSPLFIQTDKKIFIVNPILDQEERSRLRKQVMEDFYGYTPSQLNLNEMMAIIEKQSIIKDKTSLFNDLKHYFQQNKRFEHHLVSTSSELCELITVESVVLHNRVSSVEMGIRLASIPLLRTNKITSYYVDAMVAQYNASDPYMILGTRLAIPHASPEDGVNQLSMSLLRLKEAVHFDECPIKVIVVIAATDEKQHLKALFQLSQLAECGVDMKRIEVAQSKEEIFDVICRYSSR